MAENQGQLIGDQVLELTIFVGKPRDTGLREVFVAVVTARGTRQTRVPVADWVGPDRISQLVARIVHRIETGQAYTWQLRAQLEHEILEAEGAPF